MDNKKLLDRLDKISQKFGNTDKEIQYSNLAHKVHGLLTNKSGKLKVAETRGLTEIGEKVAELAEGSRGAPKPLRSNGGKGQAGRMRTVKGVEI